VRKASRSLSSSPQIRDTSDLEIPEEAPSAFTRSSTFLVETPFTYASITTPYSALSMRLRRSKREGKNVPSLSFGIFSSRSPAALARSLWRCPLRMAVRVSDRSFGPAPMVAVSSASISCCRTQVREVRMFSVSSPA
jgi:hypothetical protein